MSEEKQSGTPPSLPCHDEGPLSAAPGSAPETAAGGPATGADAAAGPQQHVQTEAPQDDDAHKAAEKTSADSDCLQEKEEVGGKEGAATAAADAAPSDGSTPLQTAAEALCSVAADGGDGAGEEALHPAKETNPAKDVARGAGAGTVSAEVQDSSRADDLVGSAHRPSQQPREQEAQEMSFDAGSDVAEADLVHPGGLLSKFAPAGRTYALEPECMAGCASSATLAAYGVASSVDASLLQADFYGAGCGGPSEVFRGGIGACEGASRTPSPRVPIHGVKGLASAATDAKLRWSNLYGTNAGSPRPAPTRGGGEPKGVPPGVRNPRRRRQLDLAKLKEAMEVSATSAEAEKSGLSDWVENVWEEALALEPLLSLAAHPEFATPPHFFQAMDTCMACLLHAPQDHLLQAERMAKLLDSSDAEPLLDYLDWLEAAVEEVHPSLGHGSCRTVVVPQRVSGALSSWPSECALLQKSATALCEALLAHGPEHCRNHGEWRKAVDVRDGIQCQQEEECMQIARDLEEATAHFTSQLQELSGDEWTHLARTSHASLSKIQQLTTELLQQQREVWSDALEEYEAMAAQATTCCAAVCEARRQVKRHEQAFRQATRRFTEVASQLVAWTSGLVPKLRLMMSHRDDLRSLVSLRRRLPLLEREHLAAEDELDMAQTELRKNKRHARSSRGSQSQARPTIDAAAGAILERQCELRVKHAEERVQSLSNDLWEMEQKLQEAEAALPLVVEPDDDEDDAGSTGGQRSPRQNEHLTAEERLALKLATLEQFHEDVAMQVSQVQAERDQVLKQVCERKEQAAAKLQIELDFMCPIMHEKMTEPVLAADGHTYERAAIEKWLQLHNTSPMTGAPLAHRYLTENFALRHVIASYDARMKAKEEEEDENGKVSTGCGFTKSKEGEGHSEDSEDEELYGRIPGQSELDGEEEEWEED